MSDCHESGIISLDRRKFIRNASIASLSASCLLEACGASAGYPIIDTHQHLWDLDQFPLSWVREPLDQNFLMADYLHACKGHPVVHSIYMEVGVPAELRLKEAEWALGLCEDPGNPTVGAVVRLDPGDKDFSTHLENLSNHPGLKGIRYTPGMLDKSNRQRIFDGIRLLGKYDLSMDMNLPARRLGEAVQILDSCPEVRFIIDHCGNADPVAFLPADRKLPRRAIHEKSQWYRDMENLAKRSHCDCKISGMVDNVQYSLTSADLAPVVNHCLDVFGPERVMFGGDWPVCLRNMSLASWINLLQEIVAQRSVPDQRKLFHDNALTFYRLDTL